MLAERPTGRTTRPRVRALVGLLLQDLEVVGQLGPPVDALGVEVLLDDIWVGLGDDLAVRQVVGAGERGDEGVCVGALHGNAEELPGEDVARAVEAA